MTLGAGVIRVTIEPNVTLTIRARATREVTSVVTPRARAVEADKALSARLISGATETAFATIKGTGRFEGDAGSVITDRVTLASLVIGARAVDLSATIGTHITVRASFAGQRSQTVFIAFAGATCLITDLDTEAVLALPARVTDGADVTVASYAAETERT